MKVHAWYIDPNGIEYKNTIKYPYPIGIEKKWYQFDIGFNHIASLSMY